jgi:glycoside/pentoside/hexuronide:cation symporter, GPH family
MTAAADRLPLSLKLAHGIGSIAYGIKDNGFSTFLLIFYNQVIGLDARMVSAALMIVLIVDAFADPVIGHLSDRTYTRWGRRLPWLYIAPIPLAIAWIFLWSPPTDRDTVFYYLICVGLLVRTLLSACEVPSASLIPELTKDYDERTGLMRFRYLFGWTGGLFIAILAYAVFLVPSQQYPVGQLNETGYLYYGFAGGALIVISVILSALGQHKAVTGWPATKPAKTSIKQAFGEIIESLSHPAAIILLSAAAVAYTSQGVTFSIANYLYLYVWEYPQWAFTAYPLMLLATVLVAFFIVTPLNKRFGKRETAMATGLVGVVFWITPFLLRVAGLWPPTGGTLSTLSVMAFAFVANVASVTVMISAQSMVADIVEASQVVTGRRTEGVFSAGWLFAQKCATGLGIFITGMIVSWSGLPAKAVPGAVDPAVVTRLILSYSAIVIIAVIVSTWIFAHFPISRADHEARVRALAAQNAL